MSQQQGSFGSTPRSQGSHSPVSVAASHASHSSGVAAAAAMTPPVSFSVFQEGPGQPLVFAPPRGTPELQALVDRFLALDVPSSMKMDVIERDFAAHTARTNERYKTYFVGGAGASPSTAYAGSGFHGSFEPAPRQSPPASASDLPDSPSYPLFPLVATSAAAATMPAFAGAHQPLFAAAPLLPLSAPVHAPASAPVHVSAPSATWPMASVAQRGQRQQQLQQQQLQQQQQQQLQQRRRRLSGTSSMQILTASGEDITHLSNRSMRTREERENTRLVRQRGACPECRRKKTRCSPGHAGFVPDIRRSTAAAAPTPASRHSRAAPYAAPAQAGRVREEAAAQAQAARQSQVAEGKKPMVFTEHPVILPSASASATASASASASSLSSSPSMSSPSSVSPAAAAALPTLQQQQLQPQQQHHVMIPPTARVVQNTVRPPGTPDPGLGLLLPSYTFAESSASSASPSSALSSVPSSASLPDADAGVSGWAMLDDSFASFDAFDWDQLLDQDRILTDQEPDWNFSTSLAAPEADLTAAATAAAAAAGSAVLTSDDPSGWQHNTVGLANRRYLSGSTDARLLQPTMGSPSHSRVSTRPEEAVAVNTDRPLVAARGAALPTALSPSLLVHAARTSSGEDSRLGLRLHGQPAESVSVAPAGPSDTLASASSGSSTCQDGCDGQHGCDGSAGCDGGVGCDGCDGCDGVGCDGCDGNGCDGNGCDGDGCDGCDGDGCDGRDGCDGCDGCNGRLEAVREEADRPSLYRRVVKGHTLAKQAGDVAVSDASDPRARYLAAALVALASAVAPSLAAWVAVSNRAPVVEERVALGALPVACR